MVGVVCSDCLPFFTIGYGCLCLLKTKRSKAADSCLLFACMKTISLLQPWASLVVMGVKTIETRSWQTTYRGPLLIHASKGKKGSALCNRALLRQHIPDFTALPFGAIIGSVTLQDIVPAETLPLSAAAIAACTLEEKAFGDDSKGRYAWLFTDPLPLETPVCTGGSLGLWNFYPQ